MSRVRVTLSADGIPLVSAEGTEWMADGSCTSYPEDLWFDESSVKKAKSICYFCPVKPQCEVHALAITAGLVANRKASYDEGVIAGMTPRERLIRLRGGGSS